MEWREFDSTIREDSFVREGREIFYATAGKQGGHPVLVFYPLGTSRRALVVLEDAAIRADIRLICCNRPGQGTDWPPSSAESNGISLQLETAVEDQKLLMDELSITKASLLFFCAGTPFALRFASKYPERTLQMLGVACWVSPADCDKTKNLFQFASTLPGWLMSAIGRLSECNSSVGRMLPPPPKSFVTAMLKSEEEKKLFRSNDRGEVAKRLAFAKSEHSGGDPLDIPVLLSSYKDMGLELPSPQNLKLIHSQSDDMIPIEAARWFSQQIGTELQELQSNSHLGCLLLLHPALPKAMKDLTNSRFNL